MTKKTEWCDRTLMRSPLYYTVCTSEERFHKELERMKLPRETWPGFLKTPQANATAHYFSNSETCSEAAIVCLHPDTERDPLEVVGLIVHEAAHIWQQIREYIGEGAPSAEFEAYSLQWITQQLLGEYRRQVYGC